jgi:hypothetical protein
VLDSATAVTQWLMTPGIGEQLPTLEEIAHRPGWQRRAACRGLPVEVFFPAKGVNAAHHGQGAGHLRRVSGTGLNPTLSNGTGIPLVSAKRCV